MDPISLIVGAVGSVVDVIGGGPQARAQAAASQAEIAKQAVEAEKAKTAQIKTMFTYGIGLAVVLIGGFITYKAVA